MGAGTELRREGKFQHRARFTEGPTLFFFKKKKRKYFCFQSIGGGALRGGGWFTGRGASPRGLADGAGALWAAAERKSKASLRLPPPARSSAPPLPPPHQLEGVEEEQDEVAARRKPLAHVDEGVLPLWGGWVFESFKRGG